MLIPFGPYLPDLASLGNPGALAANNVIPARGNQQGAVIYRPLNSLEVASAALSARCQGALATRDTSGNVNVFAGSAAKLERLTSGSTSWEDASIAGGYSTPSDELWSFVFDGVSRVVAMNGPTGDDIQTYVIGSSTDFADLSADAPKARAGAFVKNALMVVNTNDGTDGHRPNRVWWSKRGDATSWPTIASSTAIAAESSFTDLKGNLGQCMAIMPGLIGVDGMLWQEGGLWRVNYVGGDQFYSFDLIEGSKGTPAQGSVVAYPGGYAYLGEDGFYTTNGITTAPIGADQIDKTFFADLDQQSFARISGIADVLNKAVIWSYPAAGNNGVPNRLIIWNWATGNWSVSDGIGDHEILIRSMAVGFDLEDLDAIYSDLDEMSVSLDSRALTGGRLLLGAVNTDHKLATLTGAAMAATIMTGEAEPVPGQRALVTRAYPLVEGTDAALTLAPVYRNRQNDSVTTGTPVAQQEDGSCPLRVNNRFHRMQLAIAAGGTWTSAVGIEVPDDAVKPMGRR